MSLFWRYASAAGMLGAIVVALAIVSQAGLTDGPAMAVFLGLPAVTGALVEAVKRATWDGSHGRCADCGAEVRSYQRYCQDCENDRMGSGGGA